MATPIGTLGSVPTFTVGGVTFTDLSSLIVLHGHTLTASRYCTLRKTNTSAGYQVTAGKTLTIRAFTAFSATAGAGSAVPLYGDTDVGLDSASAPTTPVYPYGSASIPNLALWAISTTPSTPISTYSVPLLFAVPAAKYPAAFNSVAQSNVVYTAYGYEA